MRWGWGSRQAGKAVSPAQPAHGLIAGRGGGVGGRRAQSARLGRRGAPEALLVARRHSSTSASVIPGLMARSAAASSCAGRRAAGAAHVRREERSRGDGVGGIAEARLLRLWSFEHLLTGRRFCSPDLAMILADLGLSALLFRVGKYRVTGSNRRP